MLTAFWRTPKTKAHPPPLPIRDPDIRPDENGNFIRIADAVQTSPGFRLTITGSGNYVDIQNPAELQSLQIDVSGRTHVSIGSHCILRNIHVFGTPGSTIEIGRDVHTNGFCRFLAHEPRRIRVGDGCLFAGNIDVSVSDMHAILDLRTGRRVNYGRDIFIGDAVWIGQGVQILKGATIGANSIIGMNSVVTRIIPSNCVAAGSPTRVIRRGVRWVHDNA